MKTIKNIFEEAHAKKTRSVSFEIFPPKGNLSVDVAREMGGELAKLNPDFISVTYSAGASGNKHSTADIAEMIQADFRVSTVAHLTCVGATRDFLSQAADDLKSKGIVNVLALRGDLAPGYVPGPFTHASDLIEILADEGFCVGAASYPESHLGCASPVQNIEHLKRKQDAGAQFFVTQLFFDNEYFYRFREAYQAAGVVQPMTCGIMPFLSKNQVERMVNMCGASLPQSIVSILERYEHEPESLRQAGIEYACNQLVDLAEHGVDGLHVYTMNQPDIARAAVSALGVVQ